MKDIARTGLKGVIASNLNLLMKIYRKSRREVCSDLDISYTTYCDWVNGRTYPRMEALESLAVYFRITPRVLLADMSQNAPMLHALSLYAERAGVCLDSSFEGEHLHTRQDYYGNPEAGSMELIQGRFYPHPVSSAIHQVVLQELYFQLVTHIRRNKIHAHVYIAPFDVELPVANTSIVTPDISVVFDQSCIDEHGCVGTPDLIMEIATEASFELDTKIKQELYEDAGVKEYWVVVPSIKQVFIYRQKKTGNSFYDRAGGYSFRDFITSDVIAGFTVRMSALDIDL